MISGKTFSEITPRTCCGPSYANFVKFFVAINILYGIVSLCFSVRWGRYVLLYIRIQSDRTDDFVEYYAVAIGLLCFILGSITSCLIDASDQIRRRHMTIQVYAWVTWSIFAIYYTSTIVERSGAGAVHSTLSIGMLIAAAYTRHEIDNTIRRKVIDEEGQAFTYSIVTPSSVDTPNSICNP